MTDLLADTQLTAALVDLPEWQPRGTDITRVVECATFPAAVHLVDQVAVAAEARDHHPDIDIRWRTVTFVLSTHSEGGVTEKDVELARHIETLIAG